MENDVDDPLFGDATSDVAPEPSRAQFGIAAMFWVTFLIGLGISYLQRFDDPQVVAGGAISLAMAVVIGSAVGWLAQRLADSLFWATLISAFAYICVVSDPIFSANDRLIWAGIGAATGAVAATCYVNKPIINAILCAIVSGMIMMAYWWFSSGSNADRNLDVIVGPLIGTAVSVFVRLVSFLESRKKSPRYVTATWMLAVVIMANIYAQYSRAS